jgi:hypothetical protein
MSALYLEAAPPPPLTAAMRHNLIRGLRATIRRDEHSADNLKLAGQPHNALLDRIARNRADLAELEAQF